MESLTSVEREVVRAAESFDAFYDTINEDIDKAIDFLHSNINELKSDSDTGKSNGAVVQGCKEQIKDFIKKYSDKHKDLHGSISKIGKVIDKNFVPDYGNLPQTSLIDTPEKQAIIHQLIYEHLLRNGRIDVADSLASESNLNENDTSDKKKPFVEMSSILKSLRERDVQPALDWCIKNSQNLKEINSTLEFNLHRLNFLKYIQQGSKKQIEALKYSRNFTPFADRCQKEIQRLMGSLLYINTGLENSPYNSLLSHEYWDEIEEEFIKSASKLIGLSVECPISVSIQAGCKTLPSLINILQVMQQTQVGHILSKDELPIEIDIGQQNRYHSVFTCPILRQQSTDLNPPMRLICGHVISKDALTKLNSTGKLKCPYCPMEQACGDARQMHF